jgi:lactate dehydrogenase-like 2-hydroxyacid dehydrogenase
MADAEGGLLGAGETIVASHDAVARLVRRAVPGATVPSFWEAPDPAASLRDQGRDARMFVTFGGFPRSAELIEALPALKLILVYGAGFDGLDLAALSRRGIMVTNAGEANAATVADYALALGLAVRRKVVEADSWVRSGGWQRGGRLPLARTFSGSRAGIVGLGSIGRAIARRLAGFDTDIAWWGPREKPGEALRRADSLLTLARDSDMLFIACPGGDDTSCLIDRAVIDAVGPQGIIVTVARGSVMDEDALIEALRDGRLGGAGLDVFEQEPTPAARWADVPNVVLAPHHAGGSVESMERMTAVMTDNIRRFLAGEPVLNRIV